MKFIGREYELKKLEEHYKKNKSQIVALYGRRRVGKSYLIKKFCLNKESFVFEGLEDEPIAKQIQHFIYTLNKQVNLPLLKNVKPKNWHEAMDILTEVFKNRSQDQPLIIFFDELPWMCNLKTSLISIIKYYWDQYWKDLNIFFILCGSVSQFIVNHVVKSKALYGRLSLTINLRKLGPLESQKFFSGKRSTEEILKYLMLFGGLPKYLEEINLKKSFNQNIKDLCFTKDGFFVTEFDKIFFSHFSDHQNYRKICEIISQGPKDLAQISEKLKIPSGGGLKVYLDNLISAGFVLEYYPYNKEKKSKLKKYKLIDEYSRFYFKYIRPYYKSIQNSEEGLLFEKKILLTWNSWLGLQFENYCIQNAIYFAQVMGFADQVETFGPSFHRGEEGFQIDLLYKRYDKVIVICEIKYSNHKIGAEVISDVNRKTKLVKIPKGFTLERALIVNAEVDKGLRMSEFFDHIVIASQFDT